MWTGENLRTYFIYNIAELQLFKMEFQFNINADLPTEVAVLSKVNTFLRVKRIDSFVDKTTSKSKLISTDLPPTADAQAWKLMQHRLSMFINVLGQRSAQAQGLKEPITSALKLINSDHRLYTMKDASANNGMGAIVGILKVGVKKLFLANDSGSQTEVNPVCLLDFYIDDTRQRQGYGFCLFKVMLEMEGITPLQLAIDRPSVHLLSFLKKYYHMDNPQFHHNKYVVFPGFFRSIRGDGDFGSNHQTPNQEQANCHQVVELNKGDEPKNMPPSSVAYCDMPYAPPPSPATVKSTDGLTAPTRFDSERKWQQMYDSWNVLGVPPQDYSYIKNGRHPPLQSENGKTLQPAYTKQKYTLL